MKCDVERVTGYVDLALDEAGRAELEAHLAECVGCRAQAAAEEALRSRLRELPAPALPETTAALVRRRLPRPRRLSRLLVPLAAALFVALWARGTAPVVSWELARDHDACYGRAKLPAQVWSHRADEVAAWFEAEGTRLPLLPNAVGDVRLVGGRFCPLPGVTRAPHLYYLSDDVHVSLFVVPRSVRFDPPYRTRSRGHAVRLLRVADTVVGLVGDSDADVDAFAHSFERSLVNRIETPRPLG